MERTGRCSWDLATCGLPPTLCQTLLTTSSAHHTSLAFYGAGLVTSEHPARVCASRPNRVQCLCCQLDPRTLPMPRVCTLRPTDLIRN